MVVVTAYYYFVVDRYPDRIGWHFHRALYLYIILTPYAGKSIGNYIGVDIGLADIVLLAGEPVFFVGRYCVDGYWRVYTGPGRKDPLVMDEAGRRAGFCNQ